jgi:FixJ family two-component response regulator
MVEALAARSRGYLESLIRSLRFVVIVFESAEEFQRSPGVDASCCLAIDVRYERR